MRSYFLHLTILFSLLAGLLALPSSGNTPHKYALLVGISQYSRNRDSDLDWYNINGVKDVEMVKKSLIEKFGFKVEEILVLADKDATLENIKRKLQNHLIERAKPGDVVFFNFQGMANR